MVNPYWELIILLCLINIIFAVSLNLILGYNGQFSLGHAAFLAIGAYASGSLTATFGWPLWAGILMAIVLSIVAAVIIGYPCLRLRGDYLAIATLGFAEITRIVANALPKEQFGGPTGMQSIKSFVKYIPSTTAMNGIGNLIFTVLFALLFLGLIVWGVWALTNLIQRFITSRMPRRAASWIVAVLIVVLIGVTYRSIAAIFLDAPRLFRQVEVRDWLLLAALVAAIAILLLCGRRGLWRCVLITPAVYLAILNHRAITASVLDIFQFGNTLKRVSFDSQQWVLFLLFVMVVAIVTLLIRNYLISLPGRAVVAIREDEIAATNLGVNCTWMKLQNFMFGSALAGLAGALLAHTIPLFKPTDFNFFKSVDVLLMVVLGGMGSITGSFVGATIITILLEALRFLGQWRLVFYSLILILFMIFRPGGLLGTAELGQLIRARADRGLRRLLGEKPADESRAEGKDA